MKVMLANPGPLRTRMRAKAMPGEDPLTLKTPEDFAPKLLPLVLPAWTQTGKLYDFPTDKILHFGVPGPADLSASRQCALTVLTLGAGFFLGIATVWKCRARRPAAFSLRAPAFSSSSSICWSWADCAAAAVSARCRRGRNVIEGFFRRPCGAHEIAHFRHVDPEFGMHDHVEWRATAIGLFGRGLGLLCRGGGER